MGNRESKRNETEAQKIEETEAKKIFDLLQMLKQKNKMLQIRGKKVVKKEAVEKCSNVWFI